ncbi:MAG: lipase maturation factor family protein [Candidatus Binataceae bacterium]
MKSVDSAATVGARPLLIFDGDCGFCRYWVHYWERLTEGKVDYAPYQEAGARYPQTPEAEFQRAIKFVAPDGRVASAAEACFLVLSFASGKGIWLSLYRKLPGFAPLAERSYAFAAAHRNACLRLSLLLWGRDYAPPRFDLVSWFFLRAVGIVYLIAFASFGAQALGLIGSRGILPLAGFLDGARAQLGVEAYWLFPMVFWVNSSDFVIQAVCWAGAILSMLLIFNVIPRISLLCLYLLHLSIVCAGETFMSFQWDTLLLEAGFLALFLSVARRPAIWLLRWLLFRLMFLSGAVKLLSGDPHWANLTALYYHFETQPLPTPIAWYAYHLPHGLLRSATLGNFIVELGLPILIFCPRRMRFAAAFGFISLQTLIALTGNYGFFNLLTIALCLPLFDDAALSAIVPHRIAGFVQPRAQEIEPSRPTARVADVAAMAMVLLSIIEIHAMLTGRISLPGALITEAVEPLHIVNTYGLFAVMTTRRPEIGIQGSDDGEHWRDYAFKYKPSGTRRAPPWVAPYQPRLDWQMWFAALGNASQNPWFIRFLQRLLENSPHVTALLANNPFPGKPPHYVRAILYDYRFSGYKDKETTGAWWVRTPEGYYYPPVALAEPSR